MFERRIAQIAVQGLAAAALVASAVPAGAATWRLLLLNGGEGGGTFEADATGGVVSNPQIVWEGVLYDTPYPTSPPEYSPEGDALGSPYGHLSGAGGGGYGYFWNSTATDTCAALSCTVGFDFNGIYGEYFAATGDMATDTFGDGVGSGDYRIAPIPLPAGVLLLMSGLATLAWTGRMRLRG